MCEPKKPYPWVVVHYTGIYFTRDNRESREKRWHMFRYFKTFRYNSLIGRYSSSVSVSYVGEQAKKK